MPSEKSKQRYLYDINIAEISLTKKSAVEEAEVLLLKKFVEPDKSVVAYTYPILKSEGRTIVQYLLVPDKPDRQGDIVYKEEIEKACKQLQHAIYKGEVNLGVEHKDFTKDLGYISFALYDEDGKISQAMGIAEEKIVKGGLLTGIYLSDYAYDMYNKGNFAGISLGAVAAVSDKPIHKSDVQAQSWLKRIYTKIFNLLNKEAETLSLEKIQQIAYYMTHDVLYGEFNAAMDKIQGEEYSEIPEMEVGKNMLVKTNTDEQFEDVRKSETTETESNTDVENKTEIEKSVEKKEQPVTEVKTETEIAKTTEEDKKDEYTETEEVKKSDDYVALEDRIAKLEKSIQSDMKTVESNFTGITKSIEALVEVTKATKETLEKATTGRVTKTSEPEAKEPEFKEYKPKSLF